MQGWSSSEHQPCLSSGHWDNVITLTSNDSRNVGDDSRNSMDVSRTCATRTLRESSVNHLARVSFCACVASVVFLYIAQKRKFVQVTG